MSEHIQDPRHLMKINEQDIETFFNSTDMEESNLGLGNALFGNAAPNTLVTNVHVLDDVLDGFDPDDIDYDAINANVSHFIGLRYAPEDEDIMGQKQEQYSQQGHGSHDQAQPTWPNHVSDARSQDYHSADVIRTSKSLQQWSLSSHPPQTPQGVFQQSYASPQPVQLNDDQTQTPWMRHESPSQSRHVQDINQQQYAVQQYTTSHLPEASSTGPLGESRYPDPVNCSALEPSPMASKENASEKKPMKRSMTNRKQKKPAATPQAQRPAPAKVSAETTRPIAAAAPQAVQFTSFAQAMQAAATRLVPHNYTPPANDPSFPKDDAAHKVYIRRMYDAYIDTTQCIDRATVPTFDSQLAKHSSHPHSAPITPVMISTICWHLLSIAMDLHTRGPVCLNVFDPAKLKQVYAHRGLTFEKRIDAVCELLRTSKSRCVSLLKLDGLGMVVANAPMLCRQARANHASNGQRQDFLVNGKDAGRKRMAADMDRDEAEMGHASELDEY